MGFGKALASVTALTICIGETVPLAPNDCENCTSINVADRTKDSKAHVLHTQWQAEPSSPVLQRLDHTQTSNGASEHGARLFLINEASVRRLDNSKTKTLSELSESEIQTIFKYIVYTQNSYGVDVDESSFSYTRGISYVAKNSVFIKYKKRRRSTGQVEEDSYRATRHPDGFPCLWTSSQFNIECDKLVTSPSEGSRLGVIAETAQRQYIQDAPERERREAIARKKAEQAAYNASLRRDSGAVLNAQDKACLIVKYETRIFESRGKCLVSARVPGGPDCISYETIYDKMQVSYEINACRYTIKFRDICGATAFAQYSVAPGARLDRKFGPPCYRAY